MSGRFSGSERAHGQEDDDGDEPWATQLPASPSALDRMPPPPPGGAAVLADASTALASNIITKQSFPVPLVSTPAAEPATTRSTSHSTSSSFSAASASASSPITSSSTSPLPSSSSASSLASYHSDTHKKHQHQHHQLGTQQGQQHLDHQRHHQCHPVPAQPSTTHLQPSPLVAADLQPTPAPDHHVVLQSATSSNPDSSAPPSSSSYTFAPTSPPRIFISTDLSTSTSTAVQPVHPSSSRPPFSLISSMGQTFSKSHHLSPSSSSATPSPISASHLFGGLNAHPHLGYGSGTGSSTPSPSTAAKGLMLAGGAKLKRAFAGRRKKSVDVTGVLSDVEKEKAGERLDERSALRERDHPLYSQSHQQQQSRSQTHSNFQQHQQQHARALEPTPSSSSSPAQLSSSKTSQFTQLATHVLGVKNKVTKSSSVPGQEQQQYVRATPYRMHALPSPPPPPKKDTSYPKPGALKIAEGAEKRESVIPISPGIINAVRYLQADEIGKEDVQKEQDQGKAVKQEEVKSEGSDAGPLGDKDGKTEGEKAVEAADKDRRRSGSREPGLPGDVSAAAVADKPENMKDAWRKSDSTISHHTIRPGALNGANKGSRPVSMAESLRSNYTIVPGNANAGSAGNSNKRWSLFDADAELEVKEEDDDEVGGSRQDEEDAKDQSDAAHGTVGMASSASAPTGPRDRRSMSLNLPSAHQSVAQKTQLPPTPSSATAAEFKYHTQVSSSGRPVAPPSSAVPPPIASGSGYVPPASWASSPSLVNPIAGNHLRDKALPSAANSGRRPSVSGPASTSTSGRHERDLPPPPTSEGIALSYSQPAYSQLSLQQHLRQGGRIHPLQQQHSQHSTAPSIRPTAVSMTSAAGFVQRTMEKMGKAWGGIGAGSSSNSMHSAGNASSGYSSSASSSSLTSSSFGPRQPQLPYAASHSRGGSSGGGGVGGKLLELGRTISNQSFSGNQHHHHPPHHQHHLSGSVAPSAYQERKGKLRRTPNAPSISSSLTSESSASMSISLSDSEALGGGPSLGKRLRGPLIAPAPAVGKSKGAGLVFGKSLASVVKNTGIHPENDEPIGYGEASNGKVARGHLEPLQTRKLPALVVRCVQHLLIWGVEEEGLFRVNGRPSHVSKVRTEFDTGADYDMMDCSPGDLDPHAVASVFKAFLRELPEPILTPKLAPYFDAAINQESLNNLAVERPTLTSPNRASGLPTSPRGQVLPAIRKPPSLSTLAMPSFSGMRPPSQSLLNALRSLISQLPEENRHLIRTVTELINATAKESKQTKMPLSNLLLVFCPSLNMSPSLLKVLCEAENLWGDEAPVLDIKGESRVLDIDAERATQDGGDEGDEEFSDARDGTEEEDLESESLGRTSEDMPSSVDYQASTEDLNRLPPTAGIPMPKVLSRDADSVSMDDASSMSNMSGAISRRHHVRGASVAALSLRDDGSSYVSTSEYHERQLSVDQHSHSLSPPLLTSSAESLDTSLSSHPSFSHIVVSPLTGGDDFQKMQLGTSPTESLPRRPVISNPIPIVGPVEFPISVPESPISPSAAEKRRSIPVLSLPTFSPTKFALTSDNRSADSPGTPASTQSKRLKKPSLHLLFSKKSSSSLSSSTGLGPSGSPATKPRPVISGPYLQAPRSASDSSISTPRSAVTAPQSSTYTLPPFLNTPIEDSSLKIGMGLGIDLDSPEPDTRKAVSAPLFSVSLVSVNESLGQNPIANQHRSSSPAPSFSTTSATSQTRSEETFTTGSQLRPPPFRGPATTLAPATSSNHLRVLDDDDFEEDWTRSVLLAADVEVTPHHQQSIGA